MLIMTNFSTVMAANSDVAITETAEEAVEFELSIDELQNDGIDIYVYKDANNQLIYREEPIISTRGTADGILEYAKLHLGLTGSKLYYTLSCDEALGNCTYNVYVKSTDGLITYFSTFGVDLLYSSFSVNKTISNSINTGSKTMVKVGWTAFTFTTIFGTLGSFSPNFQNVAR